MIGWIYNHIYQDLVYIIFVCPVSCVTKPKPIGCVYLSSLFIQIYHWLKFNKCLIKQTYFTYNVLVSIESTKDLPKLQEKRNTLEVMETQLLFLDTDTFYE